MDIRKADSKGRLTGFVPDKQYYLVETEDGYPKAIPVPEPKGLRILSGDNGSGKTWETVRIMLSSGNEDVFFVAPTHNQCEIGYLTALRQIGVFDAQKDHHRAAARFPEIRARFIKPDQVASLPKGSRIVIDELEGVLSYFLGVSVLSVSGTDSLEKAIRRIERSKRLS